MSKQADYVYMGISRAGRKIFDDIAKIYEAKIDIKLDFAELAIYAESCVKLAALNKQAEGKSLYYKTKNGTYAAHPIRDEISMLQKQIHISAAKLGLSPAARKSIDAKNSTMGRPKKGMRERLAKYDS